MHKINPLDVKFLCRYTNPDDLGFQTTAEYKKPPEFVGQKRAMDAIHFGVGIKRKGFNIYALGPSGLGKHFITNNILVEQAKKQPTPDDWCYAHNFEQPKEPIALRLPAGW